MKVCIFLAGTTYIYDWNGSRVQIIIKHSHFSSLSSAARPNNICLANVRPGALEGEILHIDRLVGSV